MDAKIFIGSVANSTFHTFVAQELMSVNLIIDEESYDYVDTRKAI